MDYLISDAAPLRGVCRLGMLENVPDWAKLQKGTRHKGKFPEDATFRMSDDFPKDVKLADVLGNKNNLLVASERFVDLLRSASGLTKNDVHAVKIVNHKGRLEKAPYFLVHQYDFPRCVDEKKSAGKKSSVNPDEYITLSKLALDTKSIESSIALFRPLQYNARAFWRRDLAEKVQSAGMTGIAFFELDEYDDF